MGRNSWIVMAGIEELAELMARQYCMTDTLARIECARIMIDYGVWDSAEAKVSLEVAVMELGRRLQKYIDDHDKTLGLE